MRWLLLPALCWSAITLAQSAPLGPGKPGQKKLAPSSQPTTSKEQPTKVEPTKQPDPPKEMPQIEPPKKIEPTRETPPENKPPTETSPEQPATEKEAKHQSWLRVSGQGAAILPGAAGGAADLFILRKTLRAGVRLEGWSLDGVVDKEALVLGSGVLGVAYPARVTPFVEASAGGGLWHQSLFGQSLFSKTSAIGIDAGAEVYVSSVFFLFGAVGYREFSRETETFDGTTTEHFGGSCFRVGLGVSK